jgi:hypothetical protein
VEAIFAGTLRQAVRAGLPTSRRRREAARVTPEGDDVEEHVEESVQP